MSRPCQIRLLLFLLLFLRYQGSEASREMQERHKKLEGESISQFAADLVLNESNWQRRISRVAKCYGKRVCLAGSINTAREAMLYRQAGLDAGQYARDRNHWYCKYWWATQMLKNGNTALFMDNDNIVLGNPFKSTDPYLYDFEVLSDWVRRVGRPQPQDLLEEFCGYKATPIEGKGQRLMWDYDKENKLALSHTPCASAGLWIAYPRTTTIKFFEDLLVLLIKHTEPEQWDQAAFNEVLTVHLINVRDSSETLRFRLLPHMRIINLPVYELLVAQHKEVKEVVMHPCCVGDQKEESLKKVGFWKADKWQHQWGLRLVQHFSACMADSSAGQCTEPFEEEVEGIEQHRHDNSAWKETHSTSG